MKMKRFFVLGILGLFLVSMIGGVLAVDYSGEAASAAETAVSSFGGFFGTLLAPLFGDKEMLSRVFFALLLGMIIYSIIAKIFETSSNWIRWGITGAITSLALLGLPSEFLEVVRTQYGAMGATVLTVIPFMIILVFSLQAKNLVITRMTWVFYAMYYFSMYTYEIAINGGWFSDKSIPYIGAGIVGVFLFFGIGAIRDMLFEGKIEGLTEKGMHHVKRRAALQKIKDADLENQA